jgi:hypothetical protein
MTETIMEAPALFAILIRKPRRVCNALRKSESHFIPF